jgi:geranylgeranyl reductase family protein
MPDYDLLVAGGGPAGAAAAATAARRGLDVLLLERGGHRRPKPCGGLLPQIAAEVVEDIFGEEIPEDVMSTPRDLGLFYSPPSGLRNGGWVKNYRVLNIDRPLFDEWIRVRAESMGVEVTYGSSLVDFEVCGSVRSKIKGKDGSVSTVDSPYLVGADGVFSTVRRRLARSRARLMGVIQETWEGSGELDGFHVFFDSRLTSTYGYVIPKGGRFEIGLGVSGDKAANPSDRMDAFRGLLGKNLGLKLGSLLRRDSWAIPYGFIHKGEGPVLLVGDAAGFCNPLSGEGIRLGMESGEAAGSAVTDSLRMSVEALPLYSSYVRQLERLIMQVYEFSSTFTDEAREEFVRSELGRLV